ncbi:MAG: AbrB/MazE/SpoVT family DNA-binding domain-containing protein [Ruminococcus sp.]|nr:AbrB/MazE/SpoVT family DNA-binding domain-containing protein [Ruminococcus sp.]
MKATGITRRIDELGRIVLPMELRKNMNIQEKDPLEIFIEGDNIILRKYKSCCVLCGNDEDCVEFKGKYVCPECIAEIKG